MLETKLSVVIDCETLSKSNPQLFKDCGWNSCTTGWFKNAPLSEYLAWVPNVGSPLNILDPRYNSSVCFGGLLRLSYNTSKPISERLSN